MTYGYWIERLKAERKILETETKYGKIIASSKIEIILEVLAKDYTQNTRVI